MNGIDTILRRLDTGAKAEADAVLKKARQEAADITARYQAQAAQEAARLAARNEKAAEEREERLVSAAQMEGRKTILAAKQTVMEQVYDKALEKLLSLPRTQYIEVLAALLAQASPEGRGEAIFSAADRETAGSGGCRQRQDRRSSDALRRNGADSGRLPSAPGQCRGQLRL